MSVGIAEAYHQASSNLIQRSSSASERPRKRLKLTDDELKQLNQDGHVDVKAMLKLNHASSF